MAARCPWNQEEDSGRLCSADCEDCSGRAICESCEAIRGRWFARLKKEDISGRSDAQLLALLDQHKSFVVCKQVLRALHMGGYSRANGMPEDSGAEPKIREGRHGGAEVPCCEASKRSEGHRAKGHPRAAPPKEGRQEDNQETVRAVVQCLSLDESYSEEEKWQLQRLAKQQERREKVREQRQRRRDEVAAERAAEATLHPALPVPREFVTLTRATQHPSTCHELEEGCATWDEAAVLQCFKCNAECPASAKEKVVPLIIGPRDHLLRAVPLPLYQAVVCVPVMLCQASGCKIGWMHTIAGVLWDGEWMSLEDFLRVEDGGDEDRYQEVPAGLNRLRAIIHVLHWFSRTREDKSDDHAGLPPPGTERPCALIFRKNSACAYSTFTLDLEVGGKGEGVRLPTLYNVFVRSSYRFMGCAKQLVVAFCRPETVSRRRTRFTLTADNELVEEDVGPFGERVVPFIDKIQIDPPVSDALVAVLKKILSPTELENVVTETGDMQGGTMTYMINPAEPKVRMFQPTSLPWLDKVTCAVRAKGLEGLVRGDKVVIGGMWEGQQLAAGGPGA